MSGSLRALFNDSVKVLAEAGVDSPAEDAGILLAAVLGIRRQEVFLYFAKEADLTQKQRTVFTEYIKQRAKRKPVSRILGSRGFWSLDFVLNEDTLDPRPDSETLVEAVLENTVTEANFTLLDLGTGTGCLPLAILAERLKARAVGVDISAGAIAAAGENAARNGLDERIDFVCADWNDFAANTKEKFDVVISNPPYIPSEEIASLDDEVKKYDPVRALDGGADGLDCYRQIAAVLPLLLKNDGDFYCEIGMGQARDVSGIFALHKMKTVRIYRDLSETERVLHIKNE